MSKENWADGEGLSFTGNQPCHPGAPFCAPGAPFYAPGSLSGDLGAPFYAPRSLIGAQKGAVRVQTVVRKCFSLSSSICALGYFFSVFEKIQMLRIFMHVVCIAFCSQPASEPSY